MTELLLLKKPSKHVIGGMVVFFSWDIFGIERMIGDKMVCSGSLGYNIDTDLSFRT
jgi:hypothetical protein